MRGTVVVLGFLAEAAAWAALSWGGRSVWRTLPPVFAAMAIAALLVTPPRDPHVGRATAFAVGAVSGIALFPATCVFVAVASGWERLRRRGLAAPVLGETFLGAAVGAVAAWAAYVLANAPSRSLAILAGALVGGAVCAWLGWWSRGVLGPLASHILWTGPMLVFPPGAGRKAETE